MYAFVWMHACARVVHAGTLIQVALIYSHVFLSKLWLWDVVCVCFLQLDGVGVKTLMQCECASVVLLCAAYGLSG